MWRDDGERNGDGVEEERAGSRSRRRAHGSLFGESGARRPRPWRRPRCSKPAAEPAAAEEEAAAAGRPTGRGVGDDGRPGGRGRDARPGAHAPLRWRPHRRNAIGRVKNTVHAAAQSEPGDAPDAAPPRRPTSGRRVPKMPQDAPCPEGGRVRGTSSQSAVDINPPQPTHEPETWQPRGFKNQSHGGQPTQTWRRLLLQVRSARVCAPIWPLTSRCTGADRRALIRQLGGACRHSAQNKFIDELENDRTGPAAIAARQAARSRRRARGRPCAESGSASPAVCARAPVLK